MDVLSRARALFGAGMAVRSLPLLTFLIHGTHNLRWVEDGPFMDALAILDADIAQAIQSSHEEAASGMSSDVMTHGRSAIETLGRELRAREKEVESWGGEFPFQRGLANLEWLEKSEVWATAVKGGRP